LHDDIKCLAISHQHVAHELATAAQAATHVTRAWDYVSQVDDAVQQRIVDAGLVCAEETGLAPALVRHGIFVRTQGLLE
jgi:CubicO group peptidase (beta-lactamase class C family)